MTILEKQPPHFALLPFMAQGHMIPMVDIARLLAKQGVTVTILITPYNHNRFKSVIDRSITSGLSIRISHLKFHIAEAGLPEVCENIDMASSFDQSLQFIIATAMLEDQVEQILRNLEPRPSCLISDMCYPWSTNVAAKLRVPRLVFNGTSCFALMCLHVMGVSKGFQDIASETEYFVVPDIPDRIEMTKPQIRGLPSTHDATDGWGKLFEKMQETDAQAFGMVSNTFDELEPEYAKQYARVKSQKVWCIGPVSLCNKDELDKAERGNKASVDEHLCLKWLDSQKQSSVIYVCLGSLSSISTSQLIELGLGLEASDRPFVWVIRNAKEEFKKWLSEEKFLERGLVIQGWAPQVLILSHPSVGGFVTHCGWNSTLEGVTAGLPMMTWPLFGDQFCNEKFILNVIKTGVRGGIEVPVVVGDEENVGVQVKSDGIEMGIEKLMDGGKEGEGRRERARKLGNIAKRAPEEGGSSYLNLRRLIQDVGCHNE